MADLFDLLLKRPIGPEWAHGLLFFSFTFHLLFVLLTLGTAMLALFYFIHAWWGDRLDELRWDKPILRTFLAHKSLAVVFGVGPLLLIEVSRSIPFLTAANLYAPYWFLIVPLLICAFLCLDFLGQRNYTHRYLHLVVGIVGAICLLTVPGIFVAVLVTCENPDRWSAIVQNGNRLEARMAMFWLFRYLHVLGAAIVFGAIFHYLMAPAAEIERRQSLLRFAVAGILTQFLLGTILYSVLPERPDAVALGAMFFGIAAASALLWTIFYQQSHGHVLGTRTAVVLLMLILVPMLITRQRIQDRKLVPLGRELAANAAQYADLLAPFRQRALAAYESHAELDYREPETIYRQSCAFCHGEDGRGGGPEAAQLVIPPEDLTAIRTNRGQLLRILKRGVPGSGMPYFSFFDRYKQDALIDWLDKRHQILSAPGPVTARLSDDARTEARALYDETCAVCHGTDGRGTRLSRGFAPPPPDLTQFRLTPQRAFDVISQGYPGTMMPAFGEESEEIRWALVEIVNGFAERTSATR